jgi:hypothetical protein
VDHDHGHKHVKIKTMKFLDGCWNASAVYMQDLITSSARKKSEAVRRARQEIKKRSCRGLLCPFCNRGLRYYADCPNRLQNAAIYLRKHQNA